MLLFPGWLRLKIKTDLLVTDLANDWPPRKLGKNLALVREGIFLDLMIACPLIFRRVCEHRFRIAPEHARNSKSFSLHKLLDAAFMQF